MNIFIMARGVGIGDLNNDGLQDIVFAGNQVSSRVYLNSGNFRFRDITSNFKGLSNDQWYSSVTLVDINSDRWLDVYLTSTADSLGVKSKNRLWVSNGSNGTDAPLFTEMAGTYGIDEDGQSVSAGFFDYDRDGDLDLYVLNNTLTKRINTFYRPKIKDGSALNNDQLYRNNGNSFSNVTVDAGIVFEGFGLGLAMGDVNKDNFPDIYISNDYISNDLLYINQGNGTFKNEIRKYMSYQTKSSMGNDMADVNNDGNPDMYTLDMMPEDYSKKKQTINGFSYRYYVNDEKYDFEHQFLRNMLHMHNGFINGEMIPYSEVGQMAGIYQTDWSWSPLFADYDNDGDKDLIVANGYPRDMTDKDWTRYQAAVFGSVASAEHVINMAPAVKVPNIAFENTGNLFVKTDNWLPAVPSYSYGAAFADLDNDGDLDYVTNNLDDEAFVLRNFTVEKSGKKSGFIRIRLLGKEGNTMAIGAKVELWSNGKYQFQEHFLSRGYASSVDPVVHFGLAGDDVIDSIRVIWPATGYSTTVINVPANQTIDINEKDSRSSPVPKISAVSKALLYENADGLLDYVHEQHDFIDFFLPQNIIPHKFSQIGPVMAKGDLNMDGNEDIITGSTNSQPTRVFLRSGEGFKESRIEGLSTVKEFSESDIAVFDLDNDGDNDVVAVAGGYENRDEDEYCHFVYRNNNGVFIRSPLPVPHFPASVVRPFDFDHDGDMDIFVGSRVKKGMFPYANHSWFIKNSEGELAVLPWSRLNLGMVTDAIWSDYDNDGWEDLLIAREWNSLVILKNMEGKELVPQILPELEENHGLWYSLAAGDFDLDGDDDYIAGNLGENHRFNISSKYPMNLYAIDFDLDGIIDPLTTAFWKDPHGRMTEYPVNYLDELWAQSTYFQKTFGNYAQFSYSSVDSILTESMLKKLDFKLFVTNTSSCILWNDSGRFRIEKLPRALQVSPVTKMIVSDFNNDSLPDVLVAGNDYTYDIATGYYDANKGLILSGKGKLKSFEVLTPSKSGILLQGMVESLLYFDGEYPLVVAGINRSKVRVFRKTGR